jgi:WD40 repeat protein/anti-sigma factor RsiW
MRDATACRSAAELEQLLSGPLPAETADELAAHLERCERCAEAVERLLSKDPFAAAVRASSGTAEPPSGRVRELIDRLTRLREQKRKPSAAATVGFTCPHCGKGLRCKAELAGKKVKCPGCGKPAPVPAPQAQKQTTAPASADAGGTLPPRDTEVRSSAVNLQTDAPRKDQPPGSGGTGTEGDEELWDFLAPAQAPNEIGRLGPYRILKVLGAGGMGVVFRAEDPHLERAVALKAMLPALAASVSAKKRFLREAKTAASIKHDHIVTIFQVGEDRGAPYLAMEFLEGEPLDARLKRGPLPLSEVLRIGAEIAEGLAAAHDNDLIHRDIKPANIWLETRASKRQASASGEHTSGTLAGTGGRVKILDFGLARSTGDKAGLTQSGVILGTPSYMAPEQAQGGKVDHRCDLFSLGCVLYVMATGQLPFKGNDTLSVLMAIATEDPQTPRQRNPQVPQALSELTMRLLAKKPDDRPATAREVADALRAITAPGGGDATAPVKAPAARQAGKRNRRPLILAGAAAAVLALAALAAAVVMRVQTPEGEFLVEVADDDVAVTVAKQGGLKLIHRPTGKEYLVQARKTNAVPAGEYELAVSDAEGGLEFSATTFAIKGKGKDAASVRVSFKKKEAVKAAPAKDPAWVQLFNGKDLTGWKTFPNGTGQWKVEGGILVSSGPNSHLFSERGDYEDFHFRVEASINDTGNSGQYFRAQFGPGFPSGYEAQICYNQPGQVKTGSLFGIATVTDQLHKADEWFTQEVIAIGDRIRIQVNGKVVVDVIDKKWSRGHFALQQHDGGTVVKFRKIEVKELPRAPAEQSKEWTPARHRALAERAQDLGAAVGIKVHGEDREVKPGSALPKEPFTVTSIEFLKKVKGMDLSPLRDLPPGVSLHTLGNLGLGDEDLKVLSPNVVCLGLAWARQVTDVGLAQLPRLQQLQHLELNGGKITDAGLGHLGKLPRLETLMLLHGGPGLTDEGLAHLRGMKLKTLSLVEVPVTGTGLKHLLDMRSLDSLNLESAKLTDAGYDLLGRMLQLRRLWLKKTPTTDAQLLRLAGLKNLRELFLRGTKVTAAGVRKFKAALPRAQVLVDEAIQKELAASPTARSPFDSLKREDVPAEEVRTAGDGDPARAPKELVAVLGDSRLAHWYPLCEACFSPDGKRLITTTENALTMRAWDARTGHLLSSTSFVWSAEDIYGRLSADGARVALRRGKAAVVIDVPTGERLCSSAAHADSVWVATFSRDGKWLATGAEDRKIKVCDAVSGKESRTLEGHTLGIRVLAFSPDGKRLASSAWTYPKRLEKGHGEVKLWDLETGKQILALKGNEYPVEHYLAFSPDGLLLAGSTPPGVTYLWDARTGQPRGSWKISDHSGPAVVAFTPDSKRLFVGAMYGWTTDIVSLTSGKVEKTVPGQYGLRSMALSPDGKQMATASYGYLATSLFGEVWVRDSATYERLLPSGERIVSAAVSPDGRYVALGGTGKEVRLWDVAMRKVVRTLAHTHEWLDDLAFSSDSRHLTAIAYRAGPVRVWDVTTGEVVRDWNAGHGTNGLVVYSPDGSRLATAGRGDRAVRVHDARTGEGICVYQCPHGAVGGIAFSPDGKWGASSCAEKPIVTLWDTSTGKEAQTFTAPASWPGGANVIFAPDGKRLFGSFLADPNRGFVVWDVETRKEVWQEAGQSALALSPDGKILVTCTFFGALRVLDSRTRIELRQWKVPGEVRAATFTGDGRHLVTLNANGTVYVLRLGTPPRPD